MLPASYILTPRWFHKVRPPFLTPLILLLSTKQSGERVYDQVDEFPHTAPHRFVRTAGEAQRLAHFLRDGVFRGRESARYAA